MKAQFRSILLLVSMICAAVTYNSCGSDSVDIIPPGTETPDDPDDNKDPEDDKDDDKDDDIQIAEGISCTPAEANADQELIITFKASSKSQLYGYKGDVYAHVGVVDAGTWLFVPAEWSENIDKCKMTSSEENVWTISLSPSVREWFASGESSISSIGIVVRSADGSKKGVDTDTLIPVEDDKYKGFVVAPIIEQALPSGIEAGINVIDDKSITFALHDKDKNGDSYDYGYIVGDFNDWTLSNTTASQMYRDSAKGYWWITVDGLDSSKEYAFQYYLQQSDGSSIRLADAYARKVLDPDNDKYIAASTYPANKMVYPEGGRGVVSVATTAKSNYTWRVNDFKIKDADDLVIYEMLLRDFTDSSDIDGAMAKLDYLESLGVNAIELMPTQEFDGNDSWGYNPAFFFAMDKAYGEDSDYKAFIDACHERGIAVILDVVYNHATGNCPLAKIYWDSSKSKTAANNPYFNVDAPHPYSVYHDFNHENEYVRAFVKRNLKFLLEEYRFDGFRFDLTKGFTQNVSTESTASNYDASRIAILKDYRAAIDEVAPEAVMICEHFCAMSEESELAKSGIKLWRNANNAYCQSAMGWSADSAFDWIYSGTAMPFGSCVGFMESHDEERAAYKAVTYGNGTIKTDLGDRMDNLEVNAAFSLLVPGPKMIWQFGEMGYDVSIDHNGRTGRKPLHWEYLDDEDRADLHETYSELLQLRREVPTLFDESATLTWRVGVNDWTTGRALMLESADGKKIFVGGNFTEKEITLTEKIPSGWSTYYNLMSGESRADLGGSAVTLKPHSFVLYINCEKR